MRKLILIDSSSRVDLLRGLPTFPPQLTVQGSNCALFLPSVYTKPATRAVHDQSDWILEPPRAGSTPRGLRFDRALHRPS